MYIEILIRKGIYNVTCHVHDISRKSDNTVISDRVHEFSMKVDLLISNESK